MWKLAILSRSPLVVGRNVTARSRHCNQGTKSGTLKQTMSLKPPSHMLLYSCLPAPFPVLFHRLHNHNQYSQVTLWNPCCLFLLQEFPPTKLDYPSVVSLPDLPYVERMLSARCHSFLAPMDCVCDQLGIGYLLLGAGAPSHSIGRASSISRLTRGNAG